MSSYISDIFKFRKTLDGAELFDYSSKIGLKINLYPEILLLLKRGYLEVRGNKITVTDASGVHNLFRFKKGAKYLEMMNSEQRTYTTYYPKHKRKELKLQDNNNAVSPEEGDRIFITNKYSIQVNGHTNI